MILAPSNSVKLKALTREKALEMRQAQQLRAADKVDMENTKARDHLFAKVSGSIRADMRQGFMMPADSSDDQKSSNKNPRLDTARKGIVISRGGVGGVQIVGPPQQDELNVLV